MSKKNNHNPVPSCNGAWITIGSFDGVHQGHQQIIRELVIGAHKEHQLAVVVTFFPNPAVVVREIQTLFYLTTVEEKTRLLTAMGVDSVLSIAFNKELSRMSAESFMSMLHDRLQFSCLLIGYDFRLGANREGDIQSLEEIGKNLGFCVRSIPPVENNDKPVSSSLIRNLLKSGNVESAADFLGRFYELEGKVIHGDGRGKHIGLPTANIQPWDKKIIPASGVYAAFVRINGMIHPSVMSIGVRPTFYDHPTKQTIEIHILDFKEEIYGENLQLYFVSCIRPEKKFDSIETLMEQIRKDINHAREVLSNAPAKKYLPA